ncbi:MAG: transposase [Lawsonibacter sp.]|nr:transposase [Lawsonibacter sp.]
MLDLGEFIRQPAEQSSKADISLSGWLEAFVGNYFVYGEGGGSREFRWITVYYDAGIDPIYEAVEAIFANAVAYVSSDYRWSFVLNRHLEKFRADTAGYGITYIPVPDFGQEVLQCAHIHRLPREFSNIVWIDDDFMDDETILFDFDSFALIEDGVEYLNPKHFSVKQLIRVFD